MYSYNVHHVHRQGVRRYLDDGESHLLGPRGHDLVDGLTARLLQRLPQVLGERVVVRVALQVDVHAGTEVLADQQPSSRI